MRASASQTGVAAGEAEAGTGAARGTDAGRDVGRRRTEAGTSGRGESLATISSISGFLLPRAEWSTSRWLLGVRCGARNLTAVRLTEPSASRSKITGKRRAARAT